jgi:hypothetical protein
MKGFSKLPKDQKTFSILCVYIKDMNEGRSLLNEDNQIQAIEIIEHNKRCGYDDSIKWVEKNHKGERMYLNACKIVLLELMKKKCVFNWENMCYLIDDYNNNIYPVLNEHANIFDMFV